MKRWCKEDREQLFFISTEAEAKRSYFNLQWWSFR